MRTLAIGLAMSLLGTGCRGEPGADPRAAGEAIGDGTGAVVTPTYGGPPLLRCALDGAALDVAVEAPTGGFELRHGETTHAGDTTTVRLELTRPADDELVPAMLEELAVRVELTDTTPRVRVAIATWTRGVHYLVPPEAELAAVIER